MKQTIAILSHEADRGRILNYVINHFTDIWRTDGHRVFGLYGIKEFVPADVVIVHVDLSVVPDEYLDFAKRYPIALNSQVKDIRKSSFSKHLLKPDDPYEGRVIVKSNLNYAGQPERERKAYPGPDPVLTSHASVNGDPLAPPVFRSPQDYRICDHIREVPPAWFNDINVVVEKFLPEMENGLYHMHSLNFLGDRMTCVRVTSQNPIVSASSQINIENSEPHPDIVKLVKVMKFDYGKFDYVIRDGEALLLDTNKTTGAGTMRMTPELRARWQHRARGLYAYLEPSPSV